MGWPIAVVAVGRESGQMKRLARAAVLLGLMACHQAAGPPRPVSMGSTATSFTLSPQDLADAKRRGLAGDGAASERVAMHYFALLAKGPPTPEDLEWSHRAAQQGMASEMGLYATYLLALNDPRRCAEAKSWLIKYRATLKKAGDLDSDSRDSLRDDFLNVNYCIKTGKGVAGGRPQ
jgi:hypothetical protein